MVLKFSPYPLKDRFIIFIIILRFIRPHKKLLYKKKFVKPAQSCFLKFFPLFSKNTGKIKNMKFIDIVNVRKKYTNYIFELSFQFFESPNTFVNEELKLKKNMDYDWLLQSQATKINTQYSMLNQRIREFSKISQFDKKILNELMELKSVLKQQKTKIEELQLNHYKELLLDYNNIVKDLCSSIFLELQKDTQLSKMHLIISKTEHKFKDYCLNWKKDKLKYHEDISEQTKIIINNCQQILEEIDNAIFLESHDAYDYDKNIANQSYRKNLTVASSCTNLSHYVENFKVFYPETLNFKDNYLIKLDLKNEFSYFANIHAFDLSKNQKIKLKEQFELAKNPIKKTQEIFYEINQTNRTYLINLELEKKRMLKVALTEKELTSITLKQWLEYDPNGIFYLFSTYLKDHQLSY